MVAGLVTVHAFFFHTHFESAMHEEHPLARLAPSFWQWQTSEVELPSQASLVTISLAVFPSKLDS